MSLIKQVDAEPLPGYKLVSRLGMGGNAEVWTCVAPGGLYKAVKFVHGNLDDIGNSLEAEQELRALHRVKSIRHPFILSIERIEVISGELVIVMELADKSMQDRLTECQAVGLPGVPRDELLAYLRDAAEALDLMNFQHDLQHLDVKPHNLFLTGNRLKVGDFGVVQCLEGLASRRPKSGLRGEFTPSYAAPELFQGVISRHSDQYSLAIVYQELLTGSRPFNGTNPRQLAVQHMSEPPDLRLLPEADRDVVAKTLAKDPQQRHLSCLAFVRALLSRGPTGERVAAPQRSIAPSTATPLPAALRMTETMEDLFLGPVKESDELPASDVNSQKFVDLTTENAELRRLLAHSRTGMKKAHEKAEDERKEWQTKYQSLLMNKFDALRQRMGNAVREARTSGSPPPPEELLALANELERQRTQLRREEKDLQGQIRNEEVQICRERAELSRQRTEWQRLHPDGVPAAVPALPADIQESRRDLERQREQLAADETLLREQMEQFERHVARERAALSQSTAQYEARQRELQARIEAMHVAETAIAQKLAPLARLKQTLDEVLTSPWGGLSGTGS